MAARALLPDLLFADGEVRAGAALAVEGGLVLAVGDPPPGVPVERLPGCALAPGLVSAHGHAFQRALRGATQWRPAGASSFWSWRDAMYRVAARLGPDDLEAVAKLLFLELSLAGATAAGEFHYLHHDPAGAAYEDRDELAQRVIAAARAVGLRVVLLRAAYARAGHGRPAEPAQRRFLDASPDDALAAVDRLAARHRGDPLVSLGLAPHSVRACPAEWLAALGAGAAARGLPLHVHAAEQPREVEECRAEHGVGPVALLARLGALGPRTTLVHAIHLAPEEVAEAGAAGVTVCACPLTERDLGDGVVPADAILAAGARLALGVDSCLEVDLLAEARALEGHLRLVRLARTVLAPAGDAAAGATDALARRLHAVASAGGMASLGLPGGTLAAGEPADLVAYDLDDPALAGARPDDLLSHLVFSAGPRAVRHVWVAGEPVVRDRQPARVDAAAVIDAGRAALSRLARGA